MSVGLEHRLLASDYRRADCEIGIVHVGYGAFHRAHQAVFVDAFMQATGDLGWGIAAVNLRAAEHASFAEAAAAEDGYVLKTMSPQRVIQHRVIRPHIAFRDWTVDAAAAEALIAQPSVHLVTITVTESGYYLDDAGGLNKEDPVIRAELDGGAQGTVYAYLVNGLRRRMESGGAPLSILCCDNIRGNGRMLRRNLGAYLDAIGSGELRAWVGRTSLSLVRWWTGLRQSQNPGTPTSHENSLAV